MSTSLEQKIGNRLTAARRRAGLSVSDLASMLAVSDQDVLSLEAGEMRFSAQRISQLAALLELEIRWFFSDMDETEPRFDKQGSDNRSRMMELIAAARSRRVLGDLVQANKQDQGHSARSKAA